MLAFLDGESIGECTQLHSLYVSAETFSDHEIKNVCFADCVFERLELMPIKHAHLEFSDSTVVHAVIESDVNAYRDIAFDEKSLPVKITVVEVGARSNGEKDYYEPAAVKSELAYVGVNVPGLEQSGRKSEGASEPDLEVKVVDRVLRYYQRSTSISENVFKRRLGDWWKTFDDTVLPDLLDRRVLVKAPPIGSSQKERYRLAIGFDELEKARRSSNGEYDRLIKALDR
jgi:hypothetical protein